MADFGFDAVVFDLDGVITKTALIHSAAWKKMFDEFFQEHSDQTGKPFQAFSHEEDYLPYVDGKPRYKGVESFLKSRGVDLPRGDPSDTPDKRTICGLGNRKNQAFNEVLERDGVQVFESTIHLIHRLKSEDIRIGVASSSKNCETVLRAAGLLHLFETRVDGVVSAELGLLGKPEPDIFTTACDQLGVPYDRAVVVEDAVSGVQAGARGNFGLVLGIARENNAQELLENGADIVVSDIAEIGFDGIVDWFKNGLIRDSWSVSYSNYDPGREKTREVLLAVGNGYFGTRGAQEEQNPGMVNYPGTYMAGVYNRLVSKVGDREIENEDFVNCINWLGVQFRIDNEEWTDLNKVEILSIWRTLYFFHGLLNREMTIRDHRGRITRIASRRVASMANPHMAALEYTFSPVNYSGTVTFRSFLSADHINDGVDRYRSLNQKHLRGITSGGEHDMHYLVVETTQSNIRVANAATYTVYQDDSSIHPDYEYIHTPDRTEIWFSIQLANGNELKINKMVSLYTSREIPEDQLIVTATDAVMQYSLFEEVAIESAGAWEALWERIDVKVAGDRLAQKLLRLHLYHTMVTASPNNSWIDAGLPARGLHGEAYRGHIFWDELFILPVFISHLPEVARSLLLYRYCRLSEARKYARAHGFKGAMFPWQSGSDGREETQVLHLNPVSGQWGPDHSSLQRHVSLAIAYNVWQYYWITHDHEFMQQNGAALYFEICRFWASKCILDPATGRYSIAEVMGPDEFHEKYKESEKGGLTDNAYTNLMVAWMFGKAFDLLKTMGSSLDELLQEIGLSSGEVEVWRSIARNLRLVLSPEGILAQYDGYFELEELDWDHYRQKYGNIHRMDRLLKAEGKSPDGYKVAKQADTLMAFYNLDKKEVDRILHDLNYALPSDYVEKNLRYYLARTSHGSTLSRVVHAHLASMIGNRELSWVLYKDALTSDYNDIQGGTTAEGIHAGVMAGTVWIAMSTYGGLNLKGDHVAINPQLPDHWRSVSYSFSFRGRDYQCVVTDAAVRIRVSPGQDEAVTVVVNGIEFSHLGSEWAEYKLVNI